MSGVCLDALNPTGCPTPRVLMEANAGGGRMVVFDNAACVAYAQELLDAGLTVGLVIARESCLDDDYGGWASFYAQQIRPSYWVLGNEPDGYLLENSYSSWGMDPQTYADFWWQSARGILQHQPAARLIGAGLVSGQPSYLEAVLPLLDPLPWGWDIHPYGRDAAGASELFDLYRSLILPAAQELFRLYRAILAAYGYGERRLMCLEWNRPAHEIADYEAMLRAETSEAAFFCWSHGMVADHGLVTADQHPTDEYYAFQEANRAMTAIDERAKQLGPEKLGQPLGPETELQGGMKLRAYYNAVLMEIPGAGVYALSEATVADGFLPRPA